MGSLLGKMANDWFECQISVSTNVFVTFPFGSSGLCATLQSAAVVSLLMSQMKSKSLLLIACICSSHSLFTLKRTCSFCSHTFWGGEVRRGEFYSWDNDEKHLSGCSSSVWCSDLRWLNLYCCRSLRSDQHICLNCQAHHNHLFQILWKALKQHFSNVWEMFFKWYKV